MSENIAFYANKGGQGTSVTAAAYAIAQGARGIETLIVDHRGDMPAVLGIPTPADGERVNIAPMVDLICDAPDHAIPFAESYVFDTDAIAVNATADRWNARRVVVVRNCYLALRRAMDLPSGRPDGAVFLIESGRSLRADDMATVLGIKPMAVVQVTPAISRAVDAGLLASRLPSVLSALVSA